MSNAVDDATTTMLHNKDGVLKESNSVGLLPNIVIFFP